MQDLEPLLLTLLMSLDTTIMLAHIQVSVGSLHALFVLLACYSSEIDQVLRVYSGGGITRSF